MIRVSMLDDKVFVKGEYDDRHLLGGIPGAKWNSKISAWEYPRDSLLDISEACLGMTVEAKQEIFDLAKSLRARQNSLESIRKKQTELSEHEFLMYHQKQCRAIATLFPRFAFFLDTGTGKTLTALQIIQDKGQQFLVMCPKSIIKTAWCEDAEKWYPSIRLMPLSRNMSKEDYVTLYKAWDVKCTVRLKEQMKWELASYAHALIINPESFKSDVDEINKKLRISGIVIDESTTIKNPQSQITKAVTAYANKLEYAYILSGKPAPNNQMDYYAQMNIIDPAILGTSFSAFRSRYFEAFGYMGYDWRLKEGADDSIAARVARKSLFIRKEDCLDLPPKTYLRRIVTLGDEARKLYHQMEVAQVAALSEDNTLIAPSKAAALMKLRQMASGFVYDTEKSAMLIDNAKITELAEVLEEIGDKQVIIWAQFREEIRAICEMMSKKKLSYVTAYAESKNLDDNIKAFKSDAVQYMVANPQTLKFGATFVNTTYAIYYSKSYNYEEYYQSHDRIYRKGQTSPCTFINLITENTIDEDIDNVVRNKADISLIIENIVRRCHNG